MRKMLEPGLDGQEVIFSDISDTPEQTAEKIKFLEDIFGDCPLSENK